MALKVPVWGVNVDFQDTCLNCQILSLIDSGSHLLLNGVFGEQKVDRLLA